LHVSLLAGFRELLTSPLVSWSTAISVWFLVNGVDVLSNALGLDIVLDTHSRWLRVLMSLAAWFRLDRAGTGRSEWLVLRVAPDGRVQEYRIARD
jgi:hypothetical protein